MTGLMPPCPAWCATHVDLAGSGPNPPLAVHRTAPVPIHTSDEEAEVMVLVERLDEVGRAGAAQPYLRVAGVDYGLSIEQVWALSGQALLAAYTVEGAKAGIGS